MSTPDKPAKMVFISYSTEDRPSAEKVCELLESRGIVCWIAPRDVTPGQNYGKEIVHAIEKTRALVLVMSEHSNASRHVESEVTEAFAKGKTILPVRIADVAPSKGLELFVSSAHRIDLWKGGPEATADRLAEAICPLLGEEAAAVSRATAAPRRRSPLKPLLAAAAVAAIVVLALTLSAIWLRTGAREQRLERGAAAPAPASAAPTATREARAVVPRCRALVVGINNYAQGSSDNWSPLKNARGDAEAVADALESKYSFKVVRLLDGAATRNAIMQQLDALVSLTENDAVVIYFAGHGYYDDQLREGYWIPADARKAVDGRMTKEDWLWNSTITKVIGASGARHILVIADSCYGGSLFRGADAVAPSGAIDWYRRAIETPSRFLIASGYLEPVLDSGGKHSVFAQELLNYLNHTDKDVFSASDLGVSVREKVGALTQQMVQVGPLAVPAHAGGEFVFAASGGVARLVAAASAQAPAIATTAANPAGEKPAAATADRRQLLQDALELSERGATNGAERLIGMAAEAGAGGDDRLVRAVTAYVDQSRRVHAQTDLKQLIEAVEKRKAAGGGKPIDSDSARPRLVACIGPNATSGSSDSENQALLYRVCIRSELERLGSVQVIEREAIEQVLREMNLGASDLADSRARTELGKLLPASMLLLGDIIPAKAGEKIFLRLVDTETTRVMSSFSADRKSDQDVAAVCESLATQITAKAVALRPLAARVVQVKGDRFEAGIGSFHGARVGMPFVLVQRPPTNAAVVRTGDEKLGTAQIASLGLDASEFTAQWAQNTKPDASANLWVMEAPEPK